MIVKRVTLSDDSVVRVKVGNMVLLTACAGAVSATEPDGKRRILSPGERAANTKAIATAVLIATEFTEERLEDLPPQDYAKLVDAVTDGVEELAKSIRPTSEPSATTDAESSTQSQRPLARVRPISSAASTGS